MDRSINAKTRPDGNRDHGQPGNQTVAKRLAGEALQPSMRHRSCRRFYAVLPLSNIGQRHVYGRWTIGSARRRRAPSPTASSGAVRIIIVVSVVDQIRNAGYVEG